MAAPLPRAAAPARTGGTLAFPLEERKFVLAMGLQFNNADYVGLPYMVLPNALTEPVASRGTDWPPSMRKRPPLNITRTASGFEYIDRVQRVKFIVKMVTTKDAFRTALLTPDCHVVYYGHARYGRGPCFGVLPTPGVVSKTEDWENGTDPAKTGIFRMGYPYIGVSAHEVLEHGYTCDLVSSGVKIAKKDCDPDLRPFLGSLKAKTAADVGLSAQAKDKDPVKRWWAYKAFEDRKMRWHVVIHAGWQKTVSAPNDLGATTPRCHVFCHFGCSTFRHNHPIIRGTKFKNWRKDGDDRIAYFTTNLSPGPVTPYWFYHLFTYPKENAFQPWEPSIEYARKRTNQDLDKDGQKYHVI